MEDVNNLPLSAYLPKKIDGYEVTDDMRSVVDMIELQFKRAGFGRSMAVAAVVNSWVESRWDPGATFYGPKYKKTGKKTEDSVGLFMLNSMGGLGTGMPKGPEYPYGDSRFSPVMNINRVIQAVKDTTRMSIAYYLYWYDPVSLTAEFARHIEKPKDIDKAVKERSEAVARVFPFGYEGPLESERDEPGSFKFYNPDLLRNTLIWGGTIVLGVSMVHWALKERAKQQALLGSVE